MGASERRVTIESEAEEFWSAARKLTSIILPLKSFLRSEIAIPRLLLFSHVLYKRYIVRVMRIVRCFSLLSDIVKTLENDSQFPVLPRKNSYRYILLKMDYIISKHAVIRVYASTWFYFCFFDAFVPRSWRSWIDVVHVHCKVSKISFTRSKEIDL